MGKVPIDKTKAVDHQFGLFGFVPPSGKVPISAARIREVKEYIEQRKGTKQGARNAMREILEGLENFERRLK